MKYVFSSFCPFFVLLVAILRIRKKWNFREKDNLKVTFPSDFSPEWAASVAGKEVTIVNSAFCHSDV